MKLPAATAHLALARPPRSGLRLAPAAAPGIEPSAAVGACGLAITEAVAACGGSVLATYLSGGHPAAIAGSSGVCLSALIKVYRICRLQRPPAPEQQRLVVEV